MSSVKKLDNRIKIAVVSPSGERLETRELYNVPIAELFPDEPVCVIDWSVTGKAPTIPELMTPVLAEGCEFHGWYGWGSAVKRGQTLGLTRDLLADIGLLKTAERAPKTQRMLINQGLYGGLKGTFKVLVVEKGLTINGHCVDDGHGLIRRDLAELGYSGLDKIVLGRGRQSYAVWQRIPWTDELEAELKPIIEETLIDAADPANWLFRKGAQWEEKKSLVDIDNDMIEHPYVAQALSRACADDFARAATTVDVPAVVKIAVPTKAAKTNIAGHHILVRYPPDSNGSIQAVSSRGHKAETKRIEALEVIQHTVAAKDIMANGCFGVVDQLPEGVDFVLCSDDIKVSSKALGIREVEGVVAFNQWFAAGCAIGINGEWSKDLMGYDFDGDLAFVYDCTRLPVLFNAVKNLIPGQTPKIPKTKSPLDKRPQLIVNSMKNLVGFASNVAAATFTVADRESLAKKLGYKSEASLNAALNHFIKVGTDGYKTLAVDQRKIDRQLSILQNNLRRLLGTMAPWTRWPNAWAFTRGVPDFYRPDMDANEMANAIPRHFDGTIAQICRLTLPSMKAAVEAPVKIKPLSHYRSWAYRVDRATEKQVHNLQLEFNARIHRVNFSVAEEIVNFRKWWQASLDSWIKERGLTREAAACALWVEAHSTRSNDASGASVFMGFPKEAKWILETKPGRQRGNGEETLLVGLDYVFDNLSKLTAKVEVREFTQTRSNKRVVRTIVCGEVEGKKDARPPYPADLIGMVDLHSYQPDVGCYLASIIKAGHGKAWHCALRRL